MLNKLGKQSLCVFGALLTKQEMNAAISVNNEICYVFVDRLQKLNTV
jgi:hypothetical protein